MSPGLARTIKEDKTNSNTDANLNKVEIIPNGDYTKVPIKIDISILERNIPPPSWRIIAVDVESTGT